MEYVLTAHKYDSITTAMLCTVPCSNTTLQKQGTNIGWPVAESSKPYFLVCFSKPKNRSCNLIGYSLKHL